MDSLIKISNGTFDYSEVLNIEASKETSLPEKKTFSSVFEEAKAKDIPAEKNIQIQETKNIPNKDKDKNDKSPDNYFCSFLVGYLERFGDAFDTIIKHPVQSLGAIALLSLFFRSLPVIGIPSKVGMGIFGGLIAFSASVCGVLHYLMFSKNDKAGDREAANKNMKELGKDALDLTFSLPFFPKQFSRLKTLLKFEKPKINKAVLENVHTIPEALVRLSDVSKYKLKHIDGIKYLESLPPELFAQIKPLLKLDNRTFAKEVYSVLSKFEIVEKAKASAVHGTAAEKEFAYLMTTLDDIFKPSFHTEKMSRFTLGQHNGFVNTVAINDDYIDLIPKSSIVATLVHELRHSYQHTILSKYKALLRFSSASKNKTFSPENVMKPEEIEFAKKLAEADKVYVPGSRRPEAYFQNFWEVDARAATKPAEPIKTVKDAFLKAETVYQEPKETMTSKFLEVVMLEELFLSQTKNLRNE